jgi:hypothetical protein
MADARMIVGAAVLGILVAMLIVKLFPVSCCVATTEGFQTSVNEVTTCPEDTKTYTDKLGNINCCDGEVDGSECNGTIECTFSPTLPNIPVCGAYARKRRYFGPVPPRMIQDYTANPALFDISLAFLKSLPQWLTFLAVTNKRITPQVIQQVRDLIQEEDMWYAQIKDDFATKKLKQKQYGKWLAEEDMYIGSRLNEIFRNLPEVQKQAETKKKQAEVCPTTGANLFPSYLGTIPVTVKNYFAANKAYFPQVYMPQLRQTLKNLEGNPYVSAEERAKMKELLEQIEAKRVQITKMFEANTLTEAEAIPLLQAEMMYADQQTLAIFKKNPVALPLLMQVSLQNLP